MTRFIFTAKWVPGKINVEAEALSRAPVERASEADELAEGPRTFRAKGALIGLIAGSPNQSPDLNLKAIQLAADADPAMTSLRETIIAGFLNDKCNLPEQLRPFWNARHQLAIDEDDGKIVMGPRVVIPRSMVRQTIQVLLGMHQGASKMRQRARLSVFWPGMDVDIANAAAACDSCNSRLASQPKETIRHHKLATRPFELLHADLGDDNGRHFLVIVDQFSGWPHFTMSQTRTPRHDVSSTNSEASSSQLVAAQSKSGPTTDSSPRPSSKTSCVIGRSDGNHHHRITRNPTAEPKPESRPSKPSWPDHERANAPRMGIQSPAQLIFNRPIRDGLPAHRRSFASEWQKEAREIEQSQRKMLEKTTNYYNRDAKDLPELTIGDHVLIQHPDSKRWTTPGVVVETGPNRDYMVKTPSGRIFRRNRRMLRKRTVVMPGTIPPAENEPVAAVEPIRPIPPIERAAPTTTQPEKRTDGQPGQQVGVGRGRGRGRIPPIRQSTRISVPSNRYPAEEWTK
jgi:hypothetical protein